MKLYTFFRSSASYRVRIALNLKGLDYEQVPIHLRRGGGEQFSPSYRAVNPQSLVPALDDGGPILTQSLAIIEYLEERHPQPPLLPADPADRALVRGMALIIACEIHPIQNLTSARPSQEQFEAVGRRPEPLGAALDRSRLVRPRTDGNLRPQTRQVLLRRRANLGGYLSRPPAGQRAPFRLRSFRVSCIAPSRSCLHGAPGLRQRSAGETTGRGIIDTGIIHISNLEILWQTPDNRFREIAALHVCS